MEDRVFLKLSGEALKNDETGTYDLELIREIGMQVQEAVKAGVRIGIVIGGGNFWRGRTGTEIERTKSDEIGMLATCMNAIYVSEVFRSLGMKTKIFSALPVGTVPEVFNKDAAEEAFSEGKVLFFCAGTGHPYFSTDTGIVLRAVEMGASRILLAKSIDGIYDKDPGKNPDAKKYDRISIHDVVEQKLGVIDLTASIMCEENHIGLQVFDLRIKNSIHDAMIGKPVGTVVTAE